MKRTSYVLVAIVVIGVLAVGFWVRQKYFKTEGQGAVTFTVARGSIRETVKARGEVVAQKEFDLGFLSAGTVEGVYVNEGDMAAEGALLMKLDTTGLKISRDRLESVLLQRQASLAKLAAGPTKEDMDIAKGEVAKAVVALESAKKNLLEEFADAYATADGAIRSTVDSLFVNANTSNVSLVFDTTNSQLKIDSIMGRVNEEALLAAWQAAAVYGVSSSSDAGTFAALTKANLEKTRAFLDILAAVVNNAVISGSTTQDKLNDWKANVALARLDVGAGIAAVTAAEEKWKLADAELTLARQALTLKEAGTRPEDIALAQAQIAETKNDITAVEHQIAETTLRAPVASRVSKISFEKGESYVSGQTAIALVAATNKIQVDISELEIGKLKDAGGNEVAMSLDAFPGAAFSGRVASIESKEIVKDDDKYYRVNIFMDPTDQPVRPGMSADLTIAISTKADIVKIPEFAVTKKSDGSYVSLLENGTVREVKIKTGISDGEFVEVVSGLSEGQTITVSAG